MTKSEVLAHRMSVADEECAARKAKIQAEVEATYSLYHQQIELLNDAEAAALKAVRESFVAQREGVRAEFGLGAEPDAAEDEKSPIEPVAPAAVIREDRPAPEKKVIVE